MILFLTKMKNSSLFKKISTLFGAFCRTYLASKGAYVIAPERPLSKAGTDLIKEIRSETAMETLDYECSMLYQLVSKSSKVEGSVAEVGVYRGGTAKIICEATQKPVYLFDTFEGLPAPSPSDNVHQFKTGDYPSSYETVARYLAPYSHATIIKGVFPHSSGPITEEKFSFVYLDVDLYQSTIDSLRFFYPRMSHGGIIMSHDYTKARGVRKAFDDFFNNKSEVVITMPGSTQCLVACA